MKNLKSSIFLTISLMMWLVLFLMPAQLLATECVFISDDLNLDIPCAVYDGVNYEIQLDYYYNDGTNLYFRLKSVNLASGVSATPCASVDANLNISVFCADYSGTKLSLALAPYENPKDKNGLYWKLIGWSLAKDGSNQKPVAYSISLKVDSTIPYIQQQLSASDPDNDTLTYELISDSTGTGYSSAYINPSTGILYITNEPAGNDSFSISYRVTDGQLFSDPAKVSVKVNYLSDDEKHTGENNVAPDEYAKFQLSTYNSDLLGAAGETPVQPESIDLSPNFPVPGDQGRQSSCVAWATAYALKSYQEKVEMGWALNMDSHLFSPAFIYNQIDNGQDNGSYIYDALNLIVNKGAATLDLMPYSDSDYTTQPSQAAFEEASMYKASKWFRINDISQIKAALVNKKPVICGIEVYPQLMNLNGNDSVYNTNTGQNLGSHAVTIVGYDDNRYGGAFKVINSWSQNWGDNGFFWLPYNFAAKGILVEAYVLEDAENGTGSVVSNDPSIPEPDIKTMPNLTIESWNISYDPHPRGEGLLQYSIINNGNGVASAGADVSLMLSSNNEITANDYYVVYEKIPFDLKSGESVYRDQLNSIHFRFPDELEPGNYYIALWVDDQNIINESNENDNISMGSNIITIVNSLPDLAVNTWYADWDGYGNGSLTYEVINNGASSTTTTKWGINLILDRDQIVGNGNEIILFRENANYLLKPGEYIYRDSKSHADFNLYKDIYNNPVPSGAYFMALWVDNLNKEKESNELNNGSYSWGFVNINNGYGNVNDSRGYFAGLDEQNLAMTSKSKITAPNVQRTAYNGKKLPLKNFILQKVKITRDSSGKMGIIMGQNQALIQKGKQIIMPGKKISSKSSVIFPITTKIPMPDMENPHEK